MTQRSEVVVVTGASGGVGRAVAHLFARRGAHVALLARGVEGLRDAAREVEQLGGRALVSVRTELLHNRSGVWITMVQLPAVNTPQFSWCRTKLPNHPQPVPPIFQPEVPAEVVWWAAHHHRREVFCGASAAAVILANKLGPGIADRYLARTGYASQQIPGVPVQPGRPDNLEAPVADRAATHGIFDAKAKPRSTQAWLTTHRRKALGALAACAALASGAWRAART